MLSCEEACTALLAQASSTRLSPEDCMSTPALRRIACPPQLTGGLHVHPSSERLASLAVCLLSSVTSAANPAVISASERKGVLLSRDVTVRSKAACQQDMCSEGHV